MEKKSRLTEQGNSVTDATPGVKLKEAIKRLEDEIKNMDIRIGVLNHMVLQQNFKDKRSKMNGFGEDFSGGEEDLEEDD